MVATYGKLNLNGDSSTDKLLKNNLFQFTAVYNGTIYTRTANQTTRFQYASFKKELKINCYKLES